MWIENSTQYSLYGISSSNTLEVDHIQSTLYTPFFLATSILIVCNSLRRAIMSKYWVLIGSFDPLITTLQFTTSPPSLSFVSQFKSGTSPTWLAYSPKFSTRIYATDETDTGSINSLALDLKTGGLTRLASVVTQGGAPTHLGFINDGTVLGAANFVNGSAFIVNLDATGGGRFTSDSTLVPFEGSGPLPNQLSPHAHQVGIVFQSGPLRIRADGLLRLCNSPTKCSSPTLVRTRFGA
jgi:hypothetical protein